MAAQQSITANSVILEMIDWYKVLRNIPTFRESLINSGYAYPITQAQYAFAH